MSRGLVNGGGSHPTAPGGRGLHYRYALDLRREGGDPLGQVPIAVDWDPAIECARFLGIRRGALALDADGRAASVEPRWDRSLGAPHVASARVAFEASQFAHDVPFRYFATAARAATAGLVDDGRLARGERVTYRVLAFPSTIAETPAPASADSGRFAVEEFVPPLPITAGSRGDLLAIATPEGRPHPEDIEVFVPASVLDAALALARAAGACETGGVLVGHLRRDPAPDLFVEITALIPARDTAATIDRITFTPDTWNAARAAVALRGAGELWCGWAHSHPVAHLCAACPAERRAHCRLRGDYFSAHDHAFHATVFPRAYSVALVVNALEQGHETLSMFGWRDGRIEPRGFHRIGELGPARPAAPPSPKGHTHG